MNNNDATPLIRTDFTDELLWKQLKADFAATNSMGFSANLRFIDNPQYSGLNQNELLHRILGLSDYGCIFIADKTTMSSSEHDLLVVDPFNPNGNTFRVIPSQIWSVENNLSIANMDYSDFASSLDPDGVFRSFK